MCGYTSIEKGAEKHAIRNIRIVLRIFGRSEIPDESRIRSGLKKIKTEHLLNKFRIPVGRRSEISERLEFRANSGCIPYEATLVKNG